MRRGLRGKYNIEKRPRLSDQELLEYLRVNGFRSRLKLRRGRKPGEPTDNDYKKRFGSWGEAVRRAFFNDTFSLNDQSEKSYHIRCVYEYGLWNARLWCEARKKNEDIIPSINVIKRKWGKFSRLIREAKDGHVRKIVETYSKLKRHLKRRPTDEDLTDARLDITKAVKFMGGKRYFDEYVERWDKASRKVGQNT